MAVEATVITPGVTQYSAVEKVDTCDQELAKKISHLFNHIKFYVELMYGAEDVRRWIEKHPKLHGLASEADCDEMALRAASRIGEECQYLLYDVLGMDFGSDQSGNPISPDVPELQYEYWGVANNNSKATVSIAAPGFVYVIKSAYGYKIGKTKNYSSRMQLFGVKMPFAWEAVCILPVRNHHAAERELHEMFAPKRLNGEWFDLDKDDLEKIKTYRERD